MMYSSQLWVFFTAVCCGINKQPMESDKDMALYFSYQHTLYKPRKGALLFWGMPSDDYILRSFPYYFFTVLKFVLNDIQEPVGKNSKYIEQYQKWVKIFGAK